MLNMADEQSTKDQAAAPAAQSTDDQVTEAADTSEQTAPAESRESVKEETVDLDGESISLSEMKAGYMRQKDYTHKTQALAEEKRKLAKPETQLDPEVEKAAQVLKSAGFVTQDDLNRERLRQADELHLQKLLESNPDLKAHEKKLRAIGLTTNQAWEDIIQEYGFKEKKALSGRASNDIVGAPTPKVAPKPAKLGDLNVATPEGRKAYQEWKKVNLKGSTF